MKYWTLAELLAKIELDLGSQDEEIVDSTEMTGYINDAIDEAEAEIHEIHEDYFLSSAVLNLVSGTDEYDPPSDIYANKIRGVVYRNGSIVLPIPRLRDRQKIYNYTTGLVGTSTNPGVYEWFPVNRVAGSPKIVLTPPVLESGAYVTVWYLRNANRLTADADKCDIPEFATFVIQFAKTMYLFKEAHPGYSAAMVKLENLRKQMTDTLTGMVPDNANTIEPDFSHYRESV